MTNAQKLAAAPALIALSLASPIEAEAAKPQQWQVGTPIASYYAGPAITDTSAKQMAEGNFNLIWCHEAEIATAQKFGLRFLLQDNLLVPETLDDPAKLAQLDALIERVKHQPNFYAYYIIDEPSADQFPALGKLTAYLRKKDPAHMAYINLFPTYASNEHLKIPGEMLPRYQAYLDQFTEIVKPELLSYDNYHFGVDGDQDHYFVNLNMMRKHSLKTNVPFMNIIQACTWDAGMRAPNAYELRFLNYTTLAYGGQGVSYFVYHFPRFYAEFKEKAGQLMRPDGSTTPQYEAAQMLNPQFVSIATQLQPLRSVGAYHVGKKYFGTDELPLNAPFRLEFPATNGEVPAEGMLLGYFANPKQKERPTHAVIVNLNHKQPVTTTVVGPRALSVFSTVTQSWSDVGSARKVISLPPGDGVLVKLSQ